MALRITCPACAAAFTPADDLRGKKAFCPKCGQNLVVTGAGVAKRNEEPRPTPGFNPLWLLLVGGVVVLPMVLLLGGAALYLLTRGHPDEPKQVAKNEGERPSPEPERKENTILPPEPERKADTNLPIKPEVILPVKPVPDKPREPQPPSVKLIKTLGPMTYGRTRLAFSPDDKTLAAGSSGNGNGGQGLVGEAKLWDVGSGKETATLNDRSAAVSDVTFSPDGKTVTLPTGTWIAGQFRYDVRVWDVAKGNYGKTVFSDTSPKDYDFRYCFLSPDGKVVAVGDGNNVTPIQLSNAASGANISSLKETGGLATVVFSPDSKTVASTTWTTEEANVTFYVTLWDVASGSKLSTFTPGLNNQVGLVAFSPDSKTLAAVEVVGKTATVVYWDVAKGKKLSSFPVGADKPSSLAIHPDGKTLAVASAAGLKLYDLTNGKCLATLQEGTVYGVAAAIFSHDGKWLAAACSDKKIRLWEMPVGTVSGPPK